MQLEFCIDAPSNVRYNELINYRSRYGRPWQYFYKILNKNWMILFTMATCLKSLWRAFYHCIVGMGIYFLSTDIVKFYKVLYFFMKSKINTVIKLVWFFFYYSHMSQNFITGIFLLLYSRMGTHFLFDGHDMFVFLCLLFKHWELVIGHMSDTCPSYLTSCYHF